MDLLSEETSGSRVLTARHVSAEKPFLEENKAVNTTLLCYSYTIQPDFGAYVEALRPYSWVLWGCGSLVLILTCILYVITVRSAAKRWRDCLSNVAVVLSVYPLVSAAALIMLVVPRARLLSEALAQQAVMVAMYHLYCVTVAECGGRDKLIRISEDRDLETRVLPCCCWPCCVIPRPKVTKNSLTGLRYLVLQMPIIQGLLYVITLVLCAESMDLYHKSFIFIQPMVIISILSGVWGIIMCVRASEAAGFSPRPRFLALQLVLIIVKLQCGCAKVLPELVALPCMLNLHPVVIVHMIQYSVMMLEMLLLSLWACKLYSVPPGKVADNKPQVVIVREDSEVKTKDID